MKGRGRRLVRRVLVGSATVVTVACIVAGARVHSFASGRAPGPAVRHIAPLESLIDTTPVEVTTTVSWQKIDRVVSTHTLLTDATLWRRMHIEDWDRIARPLRERSMRAMISRYARVLAGPGRWARMSTFDWDEIPQPVRAIAYLRMIWIWAEAEQVGVEFGLDPERLAQTIAAIVMAESWFEHRAENENPWGNRDLGLAQCSDHCRETLGAMAADRDVAFLLEEQQYFNPWYATRVATVWFERELRLAKGDVDLAIRAYHRGMDSAFDEKGDAYLLNVRRKRAQYILHQSASESWRFLAHEASALQPPGHAR